MPKNAYFYFLTFILLLAFNFILLFNLTKKNNDKNEIGRILTEIDNENKLVKQFNYSNAPFISGRFETETKMSDGRAANLKAFFRKHNSPLYEFADYIVEESDKNGFDYRLLPAIAMQESTLCRAIPYNSHNCWGWGIYGNTITRFSSYDEGIQTVAQGLKKEYIDKGLTTASKIMQKYTPSSTGSWARAVNNVLNVLQ